jgi:ferrous iron transport protein A
MQKPTLKRERKIVTMMTLAQTSENLVYTVKKVDGDTRFISRITSVGITNGGTVKVIRNTPKMPLLVYSRDTMLAINKKEAGNIQVEVSSR